ncbi:MAG TPA: C25 family cysteine peptidase, partial [Chitinispirillaceae bacterium]|nr:C25 family cysteine peptidase [Chitinispirillaceae bacterium]
MFYSNVKPQCVIGRFPCRTATEAAIMVKKIIELEDPSVADYSGWRNRALLVADDDMQGDEYDGIMRLNPHHKSSEKVADTIWSKWPSMDVRKAYLFEYEWNAAKEKPGATLAILNEINNGVAYVNYFGHGAEVLWADEHVLRKENISSMTNRKQYPLVSSFSCDVGRFDIPGEDCLSAALVKTEGAGAIAAISSTRLAYASENEVLAIDFYENLFDSSKTCIGDAYFRAKVINLSSGHKAYSLLGDPSIQFVKTDKTIDLNVYNKDNKVIDSIAALEQIVIKGSIKNSALLTDVSYGSAQVPAYVKISLFNAPDTTSRKDGGAIDERYLMPGTPEFIGKTAVVNGVFEQTVNIHKNITYDKSGILLTAYAWKEGSEDIATGVNKKLIFHGTKIDSTKATDTIGPTISIRPVYDNTNMSSENMSLTDKVVTMLPFSLQIDLYDESGIDVSGSGPDEGLIFDIPGIINRKTINNKFQFKEGDFRQGSASIEIEENEINPGTYELDVYARDLVGNISLRKIDLEVTNKEEIKLGQVLNYP